MTQNNKISDNIKYWTIDYDQNGFLTNENWLIDAYKTEDILQMHLKNKESLLLDVGYYQDIFKVFIIFNQDWDNPKEVFESFDPKVTSKKVYYFIDKYVKIN